MHQDLYSSVFGGDGSPPWAVCTNGLSTAQLPGRWSNTYASPGLNTAFAHFWNNDVVGNLQGQYDQVWGLVARYFSRDPWILGYDLMNEPFSPAVHEVNRHLIDAQIECFYTGRGHPGTGMRTHPTVGCPPQDPVRGLIPTIEANDHRHLIFFEPDIYAARGTPTDIGPMAFPRLVFNFHSYCPERNALTGDPSDVTACANHVLSAIGMRQSRRQVTLARASRPQIPPAFMSEFGASGNPVLISAIVNGTDRALLSWCYWAWKYYNDPTGSSDEALVTAAGSLKATAVPLAEPYPEAVAGTPKRFGFRAATAEFSLVYAPALNTRAPTIVATPQLEYPDGYCPLVRGAKVVSRPDASRLLIANDPGARSVELTIRAGKCPGKLAQGNRAMAPSGG
jgi:endoglycosylceramidase